MPQPAQPSMCPAASCFSPSPLVHTLLASATLRLLLAGERKSAAASAGLSASERRAVAIWMQGRGGQRGPAVGGR